MYASILTPRTANVFASSTTVNPALNISAEELEAIKQAATDTFVASNLDLALTFGDIITGPKFAGDRVEITPLPARINTADNLLTGFIVKPDDESGFTVYAQVIVPSGREEYAVIDTPNATLAIRLARQAARSVGAAYVANEVVHKSVEVVAS